MKRVIVKPFSKDKFELVEDYVFISEVLGVKITIAKGFITNGADIPRLFWSLYPPNSPEYLSAVVLHDFLCEKAKTAKDYERADKIFYVAMLELGVRKSKAKLFYLACRAYHYLKYQILKGF